VVAASKQDATIPGAELVLNDERVNYRIYKLAKPLLPGRGTAFTVTSTHEEKASRTTYRPCS
jgi:hypothetical protein